MDIGALTNAHFGDTETKRCYEAAQVVINFLLSAHAQAKKANPKVWGDLTVLDRKKLTSEQAALFSKPYYFI